MPSGSTSTWNFAGGAPPCTGTSKSISTSTAVPRMPMVATGVSTFMSPFLAVAPATKEMVPGHQAEQRFVVRPVGVVDHFVQHHLGVRREAEHGAVDEGDAERRIRAGLDDVAFVDVVALVQDDRNAVADRGRIARQLGDMADEGGDAGAAVGLRELGVTGQRVDEVAGEVSAIGRSQRGALLAPEVIMQHQFAVAVGEDQIEARPLEVAVEQQVGIRNDNGVGRRMRRNAVDVDRTMEMRTMAVRQHIGKFAGQTQNGTVAAKVNIYTILKGLSLLITGRCHAKPSNACENIQGCGG